MAISWPSTFPAPFNTATLSAGDNAERRTLQSGRKEVRRFGSGSNDSLTGTLRILRTDVDSFMTFWSKDLNMGLNWIDAGWTSDRLGYTDSYVRIVGYLKRKASGTVYSDFTVVFQIKKASECWADTTWG